MKNKKRISGGDYFRENGFQQSKKDKGRCYSQSSILLRSPRALNEKGNK